MTNYYFNYKIRTEEPCPKCKEGKIEKITSFNDNWLQCTNNKCDFKKVETANNIVEDNILEEMT